VGSAIEDIISYTAVNHAFCFNLRRYTAGKIYTAGADGFVRSWDFSAVNDAEPGEDSTVVFISPVDEVRVMSASGRPLQLETSLHPKS
jgi:hypothetical protein